MKLLMNYLPNKKGAVKPLAILKAFLITIYSFSYAVCHVKNIIINSLG